MGEVVSRYGYGFPTIMYEGFGSSIIWFFSRVLTFFSCIRSNSKILELFINGLRLLMHLTREKLHSSFVGCQQLRKECFFKIMFGRLPIL